MIRAGIVGLGTISGAHIDAISKLPDVELAAVCDIDSSKNKLQGIPFYTDYEKMIQTEKLDVVHICLPHYLHVPVTEDIASHRINVFCEKPVAMNTSQAKELIRFADKHQKVKIGICLQNRSNRSVIKLKQLIDSGDYGKVVATEGKVFWYRTKVYYESSPWRGLKAKAGGGCMINQSVHTLDLLNYLGGTIKSLKAIEGQILDYGIEVEDSVMASLHYENGASGLFTATLANYKNDSVELTIKLEHGMFQIQDSTLYSIEADGSKIEIVEDDRMNGEKFYYGTGHQNTISQFYKAIEDNTEDYIHASDALMSIRLIDAINKASENGSAETLV